MSNNKGTTTVVETTANATTEAMNRTAEGIEQAAQKQVDETLETYRAIAGVKTVREGLALQAKLARAGATRFLTESATVAEQSAKLTSDVIAPITEAVRTAAQKLAA